MRSHSRSLLALAVVTTLAASTATIPPEPPAPVVIAVVGEPGLNPFHEDLATTSPVPAGLPPTTVIDVADVGGDFDQVMDSDVADRLRVLDEGTLYRLGGTRVLGVYRPGDGTYDLLEDREHGTGVVSSAVGTTFGTSPEAWVVFVPDVSPEAWQWVAEQPWIDLVTTSYYAIVTGGQIGQVSDAICAEGPAVADLTARGAMVFAISGNHEQSSLYGTPPALPDVYQVGGVDDDGRPVFPPGDGSHLEPQPGQDPVEYAALNAPLATHPYETGDRYDYDAADPDGLTGPDQFGGVSGATPSTTGRAATVIAAARAIVGHRSEALGPHDEALARGPRSGGGPLDDGVLDRVELADLLHAVARPSAPAFPGRYVYEGFGALDDATTDLAVEVLHGREDVPEVHPDDQASHDAVEALRAAATQPPRCEPR